MSDAHPVPASPAPSRGHARRPGDAYTACGLPAVGWPIFWHLTHVRGRERTCVECQAVMHARRAG